MSQIAETMYETTKPYVDYIMSLGWGDKTRWERDSNKENNEAHSKSAMQGLRRPSISNPNDLERVKRFEERTGREIESEEDERKHRFNIAFEKSLVILGNMDNVRFFGDDIEMCLSSRFDDYYNDTDIVARIKSQGRDILFAIDVTTSESDESLDDKIEQSDTVIKYCPAHFKKRERTFEKDNGTPMASNITIGLSPKNAWEIIRLACFALKNDKIREGLKENDWANIKFHPARVHFLEQMMHQVGYQAQLGDEDCKNIFESLTQQRAQAQGEGSERSKILENDKVCRYIERRH